MNGLDRLMSLMEWATAAGACKHCAGILVTTILAAEKGYRGRPVCVNECVDNERCRAVLRANWKERP